MTAQIIQRSFVKDDHLEQVEHPIIRQLYAVRGIETIEQLEKRTHALAHFAQLKDINKAVSVLADALSERKNVCIIGDFDADGATSTALVMLCLNDLGGKNIQYLVPNRFDFGYGLSPEIVDVAHQQGADVIVTVDSGIACLAGVSHAKRLGLSVVITDHHLAAETLPDADAIVNPNQPGCDFPSKNLAGVGVAFYVMLALKHHLKTIGWFDICQIPEPNLAQYLDIVAVGTVADVVSLDSNNRVLVYQGLQRIRSGKCRPGITALIDVAGKQAKDFVASDLGFVLGPRLNAAGRLDDMSLGIECLVSTDVSSAQSIAVQLDDLNKARREIQETMQSEALASLEDVRIDTDKKAGIVLHDANYHQGVIGILAGKIKDKFNRPTIVFADQDELALKGSARSIAGLHIRDVLEEVNSRFPEVIGKFGGHAMAAGLTIAREHYAAFEQAFTQVTHETLQHQDLNGEVLSDGELSGNELTINFARQVKQAGPWGQGFPEPIFDGVFEMINHKVLAGKYLKMTVKHASGILVDGIAFNVDIAQWPDEHVQQVHLAYKLDVNEFRGRINLQLMVEEVIKA